MASNAFLICFRLFLLMPLWFYMLYRVLTSAHADELTWFIFWLYLPVSFVGLILGGVIEFNQKRKT